MPKTLTWKANGFSMVELVVVVILMGILAATVLPRFISVSREARIASLDSIAGSMRTTISLVKLKARLQGLNVAASNPGAGQSAFIISSELGEAEVDWRNLCPESRAELADGLDMSDYMIQNLTSDMAITTDNRFTRIGFEITTLTTAGCYIVYDSFGDPDCTVEVIVADC